jgi:hypothetical protein
MYFNGGGTLSARERERERESRRLIGSSIRV